MLNSGTTVGRYVVLDPLGEGAMGEVYRGWDNTLDRVVALKIMLPLRAESRAARKRFEREARLTARINHPCVAHIYDVGEYEDTPFIAMEFVPGRQLRAEMDAPIPAPRVVLLARQILLGLAEAHRQGVVHRDLKPENIMISGRDQVKILDFGLAKPIHDDISEATDLSTTGLTGTPRYMAPEQIQGHTIDARTDLYALGAVLHELLTAEPVHTGATLAEMLMSVVHKPARDLPEAICPPALAGAIKTALQKKPQDRFPNARSMLDALRDLDASEGDLAPGERTKRHLPHPRADIYAKRGREALTGIGASSSLAAEMLERAIEIDPEYALAYAVHAEACAAAFMTGQVDAKWLDRAQTSLERAEKLDPSLPDLRTARARIIWNKTFNFPAETALRELQLAMKKAPDHTGALRLWGTITAHVGLFDLAASALERLTVIDPHDPVAVGLRASLHLARGEPEAVQPILADVLRLDPRHDEILFWWLSAHAALLMGDLDGAEQTVGAVLQRHPTDALMLSLSAVAHALRGDERGMRFASGAVVRSIRSDLHPHHAYHLLACAESTLGNVDAALSWLRRTANEGMPCWPWFARDPLLLTLREDPRGTEFLDSLHRRHEYFAREFALPAAGALSYAETEVPER